MNDWCSWCTPRKLLHETQHPTNVPLDQSPMELLEKRVDELEAQLKDLRKTLEMQTDLLSSLIRTTLLEKEQLLESIRKLSAQVSQLGKGS
jgi:hypothetical protein